MAAGAELCSSQQIKNKMIYSIFNINNGINKNLTISIILMVVSHRYKAIDTIQEKYERKR